MTQNKWLLDKIDTLDDEGFIEVVDELAERSVKVDRKKKDKLVHIAELSEQIDKASKDWGKPSGISTGYKSLDNAIGGLNKGHVILIGGETSNGKSALAGNIACNVAKASNGGRGVLFITLEMLQEEIGARLKYINGGTINDLNIIFQESYRIDWTDLEPIMIKAKEMGEVELVVLDYMQYLGRGMTLQEVAKMSKEFKSLALKYEVPFLIIVSLRKSEQGANKRKWTMIEIEDFMGTGAIGYDCDIGMITSRKDTENEYQADKLFVKILKTRTTALDYDNRILEFDWEQTKITENWVTQK